MGDYKIDTIPNDTAEVQSIISNYREIRASFVRHARGLAVRQLPEIKSFQLNSNKVDKFRRDNRAPLNCGREYGLVG